MNSRFEMQERNEAKMTESIINEVNSNEFDINEPNSDKAYKTGSNPDQTQSEEAGRMLDNYLQRACMSQDAIVSAQEQDELRKEMSGHILTLAAAHQELGLCADEAMQAALKQFGEAEQIGHAVGNEIGKRPSLLGSPHTISMIGGLLSSWLVLSGVNLLLANTSLDVMSAEGRLFGLVIGCISGSVIWKRRKSIGQAALWNTRLYAGMTTCVIAAMFLCCCLLSGNLDKFLATEWVRVAVPTLLEWILVASISGACSGALTGMWCRLIRKGLTNTTLQAI